MKQSVLVMLVINELNDMSINFSHLSSKILDPVIQNKSIIHEILKLFAILVRFHNSCRLMDEDHLNRKKTGLFDKDEISCEIIQILNWV